MNHTVVETLDWLIKELEQLKLSINKDKRWDDVNHLILRKTNYFSLDLVLKMDDKTSTNKSHLKEKPIRTAK